MYQESIERHKDINEKAVQDTSGGIVHRPPDKICLRGAVRGADALFYISEYRALQRYIRFGLHRNETRA